MLKPEEFFIGDVRDAAPLSLFLTGSNYIERVLVVPGETGPHAAFLSGDYRFRSFETAGNNAWHGIIIPNVTLQVDETCAVNHSRHDAPYGSLVRREARLCLRVNREGYHGYFDATVVSDLAPCSTDRIVAFTRWNVVLGTGTDARVLYTMDVSPPRKSAPT